MVHANACFDNRGFAPPAVFLTPFQGLDARKGSHAPSLAERRGDGGYGVSAEVRR